MATGLPLRLSEDIKENDSRNTKLFLQNLLERVNALESIITEKTFFQTAKEPTKNTIALRDADGRLKVSALNLQEGGAPSTPQNGDVWFTSAGLFVQVGATTVGPLT